MNGEKQSTNASSSNPRWRTTLATRWPPILIYALSLLALSLAQHFFDDNSLWEYANVCGEAFDRGCMVLVALISMSTLRIRNRLLCLLGLEAVRYLTVLVRIALDPITDFADFHWADRTRHVLSMDALELGWIAVVSHCLASLFRLVIRPKTQLQSCHERQASSHIAEWGYLVLLISLLFIPQPLLGPSGIRGPPYWAPIDFDHFAYQIYLPRCQFALPFTGIFCLSIRRNWKLALFLFAGCMAIAISVTAISQQWSDTRGPIASPGFWFLTAISSAPYWLLLRWTGYRLVSPARAWIDPPQPRAMN